MRYRRLDSAHDYSFGRSQSDYLEDFVGSPDAIAQACLTRLLLFLGEWWENTKDGLPLWQNILGSRIRNKKVIDNIIISRIRGLKLPDGTKAIKNVSDVVSSIDGTTRAYTFTCTIDTVYGKIVVTNKDQGV